MSAGIVYGPVQSRRLGRSLGINFMPAGCVVCNMDCAYCEKLPHVRDRGLRWPTPGEIGSALANALPGAGRLDSVTIAGKGEPTLHPEFGAAVSAVLAESRRARPGVPVRLLTNGSRVMHPLTRRVLEQLDDPIVKLDAAPERVERPDCGVDLGAVACALPHFQDLTLQACFVEGSVGNVDPEAVARWIDQVGELGPRAVQIYTIDRPPRTAGVRAASDERLEDIAEKLHADTGVRAERAPSRAEPGAEPEPGPDPGPESVVPPDLLRG